MARLDHEPKIARNSVFDCQLSPDWRQMAIENSVSNYFDLRSSVLPFSIAAYSVCIRVHDSDQTELITRLV